MEQENLSSAERYKNAQNIFTRHITLGNNIKGTLDDKLELFKLLCYLSLQMQRKDNIKYKNTFCVLEAIYGSIANDSFGNYLIALSVMCDDLLYGVIDIKNPGYNSAKEIVDRIKELINQWLPF